MYNVIRSPGKRNIGVILDDELRERVEREAAANERSVGAEVRIALRRHLEQAAPDIEGDTGT
jgi:plasmid stability protein